MEINGENNQRHQKNGVHKALPLETSAGFYALNAEAEARRAIVDEETLLEASASAPLEASVSLVDLLAQAVLDQLAEEQQMDQLLDLVVKRALELQQEEALYLKQEALRKQGSGQEAPGSAPALVPAIVDGSSKPRPRFGAKRLYKRWVPG